MTLVPGTILLASIITVAGARSTSHSVPAALSGDECWSQAYSVHTGGIYYVHCDPQCDEGCVNEFYYDSVQGSVIICNCDDEGEPTICCQPAVFPGSGGFTHVGQCWYQVCNAQQFLRCVNQTVEDPETGEWVSWAYCRP